MNSYYDDYGYGGYGMESGAAESSTDKPGSVGDEKLEPLPDDLSLPVLETGDPARLAPVDYSISYRELPPDYLAKPQQKQREAVPPTVAPAFDHRRISILPLDKLAKPAGFDDWSWRALDTDGFSTKTAKIAPVKDIPAVSTVETPVGGAVPDLVVVPPGPDAPAEESRQDGSEMPFLDHLEEFRWSLLKSIIVVLVSVIVSWFLTEYFYNALTRLATAAEIPLIATKLFEPIMIKIQMALVMGIVLALPFIFYFIWSFVSPGLYQQEKKWILPLVYAATGSFLLGASIAYFIIIPFILPFIRQFLPPDIMLMNTIGDFVGNIIKFILLFGVMFEMPLVSFFLAKIGLINYSLMTKYRGYAIVLVFVASAIFTPPDPVSQVMMAFPLVILYEVSILVARIGGRKPVL